MNITVFMFIIHVSSEDIVTVRVDRMASPFPLATDKIAGVGPTWRQATESWESVSHVMFL